MHFQTSVPNWPQAFVKMPDDCLVKSVNDPSLLVEARAVWANAGRDDSRLWLDYRHHDFYYPNWEGAQYDWDRLQGIWRSNFRRFVDGTYLRNYAAHINLIEELNEYTDSRMVDNKALLAPRLKSAQAAVWVWNNEYRGKTVVADGVEGQIPADCRLVICNSPVGNDVPKEYYRLSVDEDAPLGVHPYTNYENKERDPVDFRWHSGRWHYNEQAYGIKPEYVFTESGPYSGVLEGWRHSDVMGGSGQLLLQGMADWWKDCAQTAAYQEGRILRPGAWFTSKMTSDQWKYYLLWSSELEPLARLAADIWRPGTKPPEPPERRVRLTAATNIRLDALYTGLAGQQNKIYTLPAGSEFVYRGETQGDSFRGSSLWYVIELDGGYLNGSAPVIAYCHSQLAELV